MKELKRKLYKRGSSFEVTIPKPLLWNLDKENSVLFNQKRGRWYLEFKEIKQKG